MSATGFASAKLRYILMNSIGRVVFSPFWWYGPGLVRMLRFAGSRIRNKERSLALWVWMRNIFVPMYGQYTWQGMVISFFMRMIQIVFRGAAFVAYALAMLALILVYLAAPAFAISQILFHAGVTGQLPLSF